VVHFEAGDNLHNKIPQLSINWEHAVAHFFEALRYKPEGRGFDFRMVSLEIFIVIILPAVLSL
jgi:hypothetical protein